MSLELQLGIAGLGIGAFSGLLDVMSTCTKLYGMWRSLRDLDGQLSLLRTKLLLQSALLDQWQRDWFSFPTDSNMKIRQMKRSWIKQHDVAIIETLHAIRKLLEELEPLRQASITGAKGKSAAMAAVDRLAWVGSKAPDSEKALDHLDSLLAGLYRLLPPRTPNVYASQVILTMEDLDDESKDINVTSGALLPRSHSSWDPATLDKTLGLRSLGQQLNKDLEQRVQNFVHRLPTANLAIKTSRVQIKQHDETTSGLRSFGVLDNDETVIIEWKKYDASWQGQKGIQLTGRIFNIAQLLNTDTKPEELLTLKCLGFFDNVERSAYGFVFRLPHGTTSGSGIGAKHPMVSLKSLLDTPTPENLPTLEERYQAAYALALSLSIIHAVSWLHKSIRSQNILFPMLNGRPVWSHPYIVGFEFSRPDAVDESSEKPEQSARFNIYRHPLAQGAPGQGYQRSFDIYSLGVVLVELALWRPAWKLYKDGMSSDNLREILIRKGQEWLGHFMGVEYQDAALKCLQGDLAKDQSSLVHSFHVEVVEVLGRLQGVIL